MGSVTSTYDFIVVGAGPAGVMVATTLARSQARPSVLLIEAGGKNDTIDYRISGNRWMDFFNPQWNYDYSTVRQEGCDNREIGYTRGRGIGGSSAINCCLWTVPPKDDFEYLAQLTGNNEWRWEAAKERFKRIESYHSPKPDTPEGVEAYLRPDLEEHGSAGPIKIGFAPTWEKSLKRDFDVWIENGYEHAYDSNAGKPNGMAIAASTVFQGVRSTAADAITDDLSNLTVITDAPVARVLFNNDSKTAVGVATRAGQKLYASREVILSAGSLATPHILMHSGIGPADQLRQYDIPIIHANPSVGAHLIDHYHAMLVWERAEHVTERYTYFRDKERQAAALKQWHKDRTGDLTEVACTICTVLPKLDKVASSAEFANLPASTKDHLNMPTVPHVEFIVHPPIWGYYFEPDSFPPASGTLVVLMNPQSSGTCTLQSSDPAVPLLFDPKFLSHPYDRRLAVEATREAMRVGKTPSYAKDTIGMISAPDSESEEDILKWWRKELLSTWHMSGTTKMTKSENEDGACVDSNFRVYGVKQLRVADMGVFPFMPNAHTQATAYLVGVMAADRLIQEYGLNN